MMDCGETIFVKDFYGNFAARFITDCHGRFMTITHGMDPRNGYILPDWKAVLRELVARTVPAKLIEKTMQVEGSRAGTYVSWPLTYPLSVSGLAQLFGVDAGEIRAQLEDLAVVADG
jgi:hypothetical protein